VLDIPNWLPSSPPDEGYNCGKRKGGIMQVKKLTFVKKMTFGHKWSGLVLTIGPT
jgi:hypothetical protein